MTAVVCDGGVVDWGRVGSESASAEQQFLSDLRVIERIAALHAGLPDVSTFDRSLHRSLAKEAATAYAPDAEPRERWGPLTIVEKIGSGTYADVYHARDPRLDRPVALKLLRHRQAEDAAIESESIEEARLLARIRHANVVTVYGAERIEGRAGIWMELVDGRTLEQELRERGAFPAEELIAVGSALCRALGAVHVAGLLHRDVKAQNVMRDRDGRILLTDFGTGREVTQAAPAGELAGTPLYLAPEVLKGEPASVASDVYSLGVLLHHLATGSFPVSGRSLRDLRDAHARGARRLVRESRPDVPDSLASAIDRAAAVDRGQRYASVSALETALKGAVRSSVSPATARRRVLFVAAAGLALATVAGTLWLGNRFAAPAVPFKALDQVLIAAFENRTGDPSLDGGVEVALARELANSQYVSVAGQDRITQAFALMREESNATLTFERAREICLRDGAIRVFITGRVERVGTSYSLTAQVIEPGTRTVLASLGEEASGAAALRPAIRRLSSAVREKLGEPHDTVRASEEQLAHVTTPSLVAAQLYTRAFNMGVYASEWAASAELAQKAIAADPGFASAHNWLGLSLLNLRKTDFNEALHHFERAKDLSGGTTERERLFILASYFDVTRQFKEAADTYEALLLLFPDDVMAGQNLGPVHKSLGRPDATPAFWKRVATRWPSSPQASLRMAQLAIAEGADSVETKTRLEWASARIPVDGDDRVWLDLAPAFVAWLDLDAPKAVAVLQQAQRRPRSASVSASFASVAGLMHLALGRVATAESLFKDSPGDFRTNGFALAALARGDGPSVVQYLQGQGTTGGEFSARAWLLARAGEPEESERLVSEYLSTSEKSPFVDEQQLQTARVAAELARGNRTAAGQIAREFLDTNPEFARGSLGPLKLRAIEVMAEALMETGDPARAASLLEIAAAGQRTTFTASYNMTGYFWLRTQNLLSQVYRRLERPADADAIDRNLSKLLSLADRDFDIARAIASRLAASAAPPGSNRAGSPVRR